MSRTKLQEIDVGDQLPERTFAPLARSTLALYSAASSDFNPLHTDIDFAREVAGRDDVIGHGMLTMAYLERTLTDWVGQETIAEFETRFEKSSQIGDRITCKGKVVEKDVSSLSVTVKMELGAYLDDGSCLASGSALLVSSDKGSSQ